MSPHVLIVTGLGLLGLAFLPVAIRHAQGPAASPLVEVSGAADMRPSCGEGHVRVYLPTQTDGRIYVPFCIAGYRTR